MTLAEQIQAHSFEPVGLTQLVDIQETVEDTATDEESEDASS